MTNKINDINQVFKGKKLLAFDETTGEFAIVSPHIFTSTVYTEEGVPLDEYLTFKPQELIDKLDDILKDAPKEYDTFREIANELNTNKDSIVEILRAISNRVKMPTSGETGQVLKLDADGQVVFADDEDTIYTHPETHEAGIIETDPSHRFVSDKEKETWDKKLDENSDLGENKVTYDWTHYDPPAKYNKFIASIKKEENSQLPLGELLTYQSEEIAQLMQAKQGAKFVATLDGNKKIPLDQLPEEALRDTTYDLTSYAKSEDIKKIYAKISALTDLKNAIEGELKKYASQGVLEEEVTKLNTELDKKESTIHKGEVNGYAALDSTGKVPEEQLPEKALKEYDLTPYAKSEDIQGKYVSISEMEYLEDVLDQEFLDMQTSISKCVRLDENGKVPADQLPSYVDDVLEFASKTNFPSKGGKGKIYVDLSTENIFRWSGSAYVEISPSLITQADIKKLQGIEDGAQKNNVTQEMINKWNNKITSSDVGNVKFSPAIVTKWSTSSSRELKWWISDLILRTVELRDELKKKPDVVEITLAEYNNLTTKKPNTIYAID